MMSSPTEPGYILKWRWELLELEMEGVAWGQSREKEATNDGVCGGGVELG
jgi:hypothetical protein